MADEEAKAPPKKLDCMVQSADLEGNLSERKVPHSFQWFWRGKTETSLGEMTDIRRCTTCARLYNAMEKEVDENGVLVKSVDTPGLSPDASA